MKQWQETSEILARVAALHDAGKSAAIACVVRISGSAYRRPGARFLIAPEGATLGGVSGGCLEEDVRQTGLQVIDGGACRLLHYETGEDEEALWGLGLGCNGAVDIFVQPTAPADFMQAAEQMRALLAANAPFAAVTVVEDLRSADPGLQGTIFVVTRDGVQIGSSGDSELDGELLAAATPVLAEGPSRVVETDALRAFVDAFEPPPVLAVVGAGDDAIPIVAAAAAVGFRVAVIAHRPAYLAGERFPAAWKIVRAEAGDDIDWLPRGEESFALLKTHNLARDKGWARSFLAHPVVYLGLLGPRARCEEIAAEADAHERWRIYGPVGLDLGAEGPEQIAVAVIGELLAVRAKRRPAHLKDREAPIHD